MKTTTTAAGLKESQPMVSKEASALQNILRTICGQTTAKAEQTAAILLDRFGSFKNIMEARPEALQTVTTAATARKLTALLPIAREIISAEAGNPKQVANIRELEAHCKALLMGKRIEEFWVICVNAQCKIIGERKIATGSISEVSAYPRLVVETALNYNAHSVFLSHNHPGGTCAPSAEDIKATIQLKRVLNELGIMVLDHMIIAGATGYSMAQHGDLQFGH